MIVTLMWLLVGRLMSVNVFVVVNEVVIELMVGMGVVGCGDGKGRWGVGSGGGEVVVLIEELVVLR